MLFGTNGNLFAIKGFEVEFKTRQSQSQNWRKLAYFCGFFGVYFLIALAAKVFVVAIQKLLSAE
jgi:hypothetical protein